MDLYIFGAGASAAEGAPATDRLLEEAFRQVGADGAATETVWRFVQECFGVDLKQPGAFERLPAIDQIFGLVDWSLHADQGLGRYDTPLLHQVRRELEQAVCTALERVLAKRGEDGPHARFAANLSRAGRPFVLVSFNYDTLLDGALAAAGLGPDYGLTRPDLGNTGEMAGGDALLLKLHGSLNWWLCKACDHLAAESPTAGRPGAVGAGPAAALRCRRCRAERLHRLIVSPTWAKSYSPPVLRHLWDLALEAVQVAERLILVGYSMPKADIAVHHLIRRGFLSRRAPGRPQVSVITRSKESDRHFRRLFGPAVRVDPSGFSGELP